MAHEEIIVYTRIDSPVGKLLLTGHRDGLQRLNFDRGKKAERLEDNWKESVEAFKEVIRQLRAYFAGELKKFAVPLKMSGTEFQMSVWRGLLEIPYGETISYGELAKRLGNPNAMRAVGLANGSNPIAIIVPCHRVIGSNGKLTGFGGGLENKEKLLSLEKGQLRLL
jgi:methylated-DNA-[protein]-cysteine S-methyltransferase